MNKATAPLLSLGVLSFAATLAGCGAPAGTATLPVQSLPAPAGTAIRADHGDRCEPGTIARNFNATAIAAGSYLWFTSAVSTPGYSGPLNFKMSASTITFTDGKKSYRIAGPDMRFTLTGAQTVHLSFKAFRDHWRLVAPNGTEGNALLNGIAYRVGGGLPGGLRNVTWSAKFYGKYPREIRWQWGAAVYTRFSDNYHRLAVKALDDKHYHPYNSDPAGTPEAFKQFVVAGATGNGGSNYTGGLGPSLTMNLCRPRLTGSKFRGHLQ